MPDISLLDTLPAVSVGVGLEEIRRAVAESGRKVVALDDDPTGVQTVHDTAVLARWTVEALEAELNSDAPLFFLLTNSRSVSAGDAGRLNREIARDLIAAQDRANVGFAVASRSDSTLRGHYPAETDALADILGAIDGILVVPAFFEGGRYTIDDIHYVKMGDQLVPAAETEFAKDATFGYRHSNLREWVQEKTGGGFRASEVASISIELIRNGGPQHVAGLLKTLFGRRPVVVNAASYEDLQIVALGVLEAEAAGKRFIYRTAASFVRARAGLAARDLLTREDLLGRNAPPYVPGLVVVGSHVKRSGEQLALLLEMPKVAPIEISVPAILGESASSDRQIAEAGNAAEAALRAGLTPVIFTSREVVQASGDDQLQVSRAVSGALVQIVASVETRPGFVVGKGGITSSDIGTEALGARRAVVLGQIRAGIPVWRLGPETRFPELPYVVFPGNVGGPEALAEVVGELRGG